MLEVVCIAMAIYFEARSEPLDGQVAVANTIMNRVASPKFPDTPCQVVKQGRTWNGKPEVILDQGAYTLALSIALNHPRLVDISGGSTYYHRDDVDPYWVTGLTVQRKIGRHLFYSEQ